MTLQTYLMTDQPETCPHCGARTDFDQLSPLIQKHRCLGCGYEYLCEDDCEDALT